MNTSVVKPVVIAFGVLGVAVLVIFSVPPSQQSGGGGEPEIVPKLELWASGDASTWVDEHNYTEFLPRTDNKTIYSWWSYYPNPPSAEWRDTVDFVYSLSYWPTAVAAEGLSLYVGGLQADGDTVIELWEFEKPLTSPTEGTVLNRDSVTVLYEDDVEGRKGCKYLFSVRGIDDQLLVFMEGSRELWRFKYSAPSWTLVASPSDSSAEFVVPQLDHVLWEFDYSYLHVTEGAMYVLGHPHHDDVVIFFDAYPLNGVIDDVDVLTAEEWAAAGYGDGSNYISSHPF